jgi:superfamily II DNA or RNA helicase
MKESVHLAARKVGEGLSSKVYLLWDEQLLTLVNFPKDVEKELTFTIKELATVNFKRQTQRTRSPVFEKTSTLGVSVLKTHQGFWKRILEWTLAQQLPLELIDLRKPDLLPLPKLGLMRGFRFKQRELTEQALNFGCSGCIEAATRYGKSGIARNILRCWPKTQTVVTLPGADLLEQTVEEMREALPEREIKQIGGGSKVRIQSEDITVCSMDSLHLLDPGPVRLMILDEPHACVAKSRIVHIPNFHLARKYALGATLTGRYDGRDHLLEGLVGPVLASRPYRAARAEGAVCLIKVLMIRWPIDDSPGDRDRAYEEKLFLNDLFGRLCRYLSDVVIPKDWQSLFFIKTEEQADFLSEWIGKDVSVAMAKKFTSKKARNAVRDRVASNRIKRVICSNIYVQGVTFHDIMFLMNCCGGGASTSTIQRPGRLAEVLSGKTAGVLGDVLFCARRNGPVAQKLAGPGVNCLIRESEQRLAEYHKTGYEVHVVERNEIEAWFLAQNIQPPHPHD